ncbi:hypothetical protein J3459_017398 [Metarhizium acridum]|uniref:uncharacterized protein n=1 Tax=Metarhizium acridum TaxID=92637 RepID=UPI001C6AC0CE|nr:hypothetical protein J3459_017398 [Metarhizium acridum]KAG8413404.1 hypothetical protein J3458_012973 [Metarhizium acridum]
MMHYNLPTIISRPYCDPYTAAYSVVRSAQFISAILVAAVCGIDLGAWSRLQLHADSRWVYAEVVSGLSVMLSLVLGIQGPGTQSAARLACRCLLDSVVSLLWLVSSAVYGKIATNGTGVVVLPFSKSAVNAAFYLSILSTLIWLTAAITTCVPCRRRGKARIPQTQVANFVVEEDRGLGEMSKVNLVEEGEGSSEPPPPYSLSEAKNGAARAATRLGKAG